MNLNMNNKQVQKDYNKNVNVNKKRTQLTNQVAVWRDRQKSLRRQNVNRQTISFRSIAADKNVVFI